MLSKTIFRSFILFALFFSKSVVGANVELEETTIRALSVTQTVVAGALFILPWANSTMRETTSSLTCLLSVSCGVADLVSAVHFPRSKDRNRSLNPYLVFGFLELLTSVCCFRNDTFGWVGAAFLVYSGAERYLMASLLAKYPYVSPFERACH